MRIGPGAGARISAWRRLLAGLHTTGLDRNAKLKKRHPAISSANARQSHDVGRPQIVLSGQRDHIGFREQGPEIHWRIRDDHRSIYYDSRHARAWGGNVGNFSRVTRWFDKSDRKHPWNANTSHDAGMGSQNTPSNGFGDVRICIDGGNHKLGRL